MTLERILLIRHGETDWNATHRWQGFALTDLNDRGGSQAVALARYLAERPIRSIFSSDLPRTVQTATPLAEKLGLSPKFDKRWREVNVGKMQGMTNAEIEQKYPEETAARRADFWDYTFPEGESRRQLQVRAHAAWLSVVEDAIGPEAVVISHGGTLKVLLHKLTGDDDTMLQVSIENTSITSLERNGSDWILRGISETPHLSV